MQAALGDIATIRTGTVFRDQSPQATPEGNVCSLTIKDIVADWPPNTNLLDRIRIDEALLKNCVAPGEVLIPSRGDYYPARYFSGSDFPIFPVGQINLILPSSGVLGTYLSWHLNQPEAQRQIKRLLTGTNIKSLTKPSLQSILVWVPDLSTQHEIATLQELWLKSKIKKNRLLRLEELEIEETCRRLALPLNLHYD
jgi:restriction endonuclease S subunit